MSHAAGVDQPSEGIVRRIQKLLSLAKSGNNSQEEAASAMAMAQKMLARYNLDYHTVQAGAGSFAEERREKTQMAYSATYKWQRDLWNCVAEVNFCWHWTTKQRGLNRFKANVYAERHMLIGRESNLLSVRLMGEYLCDTMERILPYPNNERHSRSAHSWKEGLAHRLIERLREQYEKSQKRPKAAGASTALTLFDVAAREHAANYDARHGKGAWERKEKADAEWEAGAAERAAQAAEEAAKEEREWLDYLQKETPDQKKKREREEEKDRLRAARASERLVRRWRNEDIREARKTDRSAYHAGCRAGDGINLSRQVSPGTSQKNLKA